MKIRHNKSFEIWSVRQDGIIVEWFSSLYKSTGYDFIRVSGKRTEKAIFTM
jgi:hypothetical protein